MDILTELVAVERSDQGAQPRITPAFVEPSVNPLVDVVVNGRVVAVRQSEAWRWE